jgi:hypothetical protein
MAGDDSDRLQVLNWSGPLDLNRFAVANLAIFCRSAADQQPELTEKKNHD